MRFRTIDGKGRKYSAYGLFASHPDRFAAILEDPSGSGRQFLVSRQGERMRLDDVAAGGETVLQAWKERLAEGSQASPAIRCLFYAAYECANLIEKLPAPRSALPGPALWIHYPDYALCFDDGLVHLAAVSELMLDELESLLDAGDEAPPVFIPPVTAVGKIHVTPAAAYKQAVERVKQYIAAGDIFQANIARFWRMPFDEVDLLPLYDRLRRVNPAPFSAMLRIDGGDAPLSLVSASPERLFSITADGRVETRPIAGTRRRGEGDDDDALSAELLLSEKERAEHIMLVDLERNDLGRVCIPGSVRVNECMVVERYATVQHIVSNVQGALAEGMNAVDLFRAMFPGGTITGCPKVRCMQIVHELEGQARGPYTGGIGYVAWDGSADMNILIRTFWHHQGELSWAAGAGIVADSDPEHELIETEHKAAGLFRALD